MLVVVGWSGLVRPLLDGDSLSYHLPNAASWVHAHSFWTMSTYYWWYPPTSELFAAGVLAIGGPATLGLAGFVAVALLALRIAELAREARFRPLEAVALSCALVTVPTIALQTASLQNDVWLAALLLECYWVAAHTRREVAVWALAALTKPVGAIFSMALGLLSRRSRLELGSVVAITLAWMLHDAILSPEAIIPLSHQAYSDLIATSIIGRGFEEIRTLAAAIWDRGPGMIALSCCCLLSPFVARTAVVRSAPLVFLALYLFEPFGFATFADPQLSTGMSLRFALPAFVFGFVATLPRLRKRPATTAIAAGLLVAWQIRGIVDIFWNDANTRGSLVVGSIVAVVAYAAGRHRHVIVPLALVAVESYAALLNGSPARYYDARISHDAKSSALFDWIGRVKPSKIVVRDFAAGMFSVVSPSTAVANADLRDDCLQAVRASAILISSTRHATRSDTLRHASTPTPRCGTILYRDAAAIVVRP